MLRVLIVALASWATLAAARVAPHDYTIKLFNASAAMNTRYSNDVLEDAQLDAPGLIKKYGYPVEVHSVTTPDGYILEMHRIPHGRDRNNAIDKNKPVVFVMHGILVSSAAWLLTGPRSSLAYILADEGFDVWLGNARGNTYSRRHTHLSPDAILNTDYWNFSWDEIGHLDLPAMIDYALNHTGKQKLHYIGHSQGTTSFFVMGALRPDFVNEKLISMHALAPIAYMAHNQMLLLKFISPFANSIEAVASLFGIGEFLPNNAIYGWAGQKLCKDQVVTQAICSNIIFLIGGWNEEQHNATLLPIIFSHCPAGSSVRQLVHYAQGITGKEFRRYDHGSWIANRRAYGSIRPPHYDVSKIIAPVFLHYSDHDQFAHVRDVDRIFAELGRPIGKFRVPLPNFSHVDFMWGIDVNELVYNRVIDFILAMEANTLSGIDIDKSDSY